MSTSTFWRMSRTAAVTTSTATSSAATASAQGSPARVSRRPASTAIEPTRSEAKCSALAASAGLDQRREARYEIVARLASMPITTATTPIAHQAASTPWSPPCTSRTSAWTPIRALTSTRKPPSPSAARCSALPWP